MSLLRTRRAETVSAEAVAAQAQALRAALDSGGEQLDEAEVAAARRLVDKVSERTSIAGNHTVVALAGPTGSGKSSLFNALVGRPVATVGVRRPTTSTPTAAVWGPEPAGALLDWLGIPSRHLVEPDDGSAGWADLDRLVLLDLPDFDSRVASHRVEAARILELVDVFVWVTDPQKYADSLLHDDYLGQLSSHETVTVVVLNQADRLSAEAAQRCQQDLRRLLALDGFERTDVHLTSTATGQGLPQLRERLRAAVESQDAARQRLRADLVDCATRLRTEVADAEPRLGEEADSALVAALAQAAGVPLVLRAVAADYKREAGARSGWVFTRWLRSLRPDPLGRLRLDRADAADGPDSARAVLGRSSLPPPSPSARAEVALAARRLAGRASAGLPVAWASAVESAAEPAQSGLADALDQSILHTPLRSRRPAWWTLAGALQALLGAAVIVGALWLVALGVMGWLQLPALPTPTVGELPAPTLLVAGGLVLGLLAALVARALANVGAARRRRVVERRLRDGITAVAQGYILDPVNAVLDRHRATREHLDRARRR